MLSMELFQKIEEQSFFKLGYFTARDLFIYCNESEKLLKFIEALNDVKEILFENIVKDETK